MTYSKAVVMLSVLVLALGACARANVTTQKTLTYAELADMLKKNPQSFSLVDVRTPGEYEAGHIPGAVNIPVDVIADQPPTQDTGRLIVLYCRSGSRASTAQNALMGQGYGNVVNFGGIGNWLGPLNTGTDP